MEFTKELLEKARSAKTAEELLELSKAEGVELTAEEAEKAFADLHKSGELSDEELDNVTGGCSGRFTPSPDGKVGSENKVVFLYEIGQEVEIYTDYDSSSTRTKRCIVIDRKVESDWSMWKDVFDAPSTYWPKYYCQRIGNSGDKRWYCQYEIELP